MLFGTYITNSYIYLNLVSKIILSTCMIYIAFLPKNFKILCKYLIIFYLTSFVFGGCAFFLLYYIKPQEILYKNGFLTGTYPIKIALLGGIVGLAILSIAFKVIKNRLSKNDMFCETEISYRGEKVSVRTMIDTGNLLKDPITKMPVIIIEKEQLKKVMDSEVLDSLNGILNGADDSLIEKIGEDYISRFRLIPFSSLGKQNGMLIGFKPDQVIIKLDEIRITKEDVIVGIYDKEISKSGNYFGLVGLDILEERSEVKT